jgi:hypothetical protein
VERIEEAISEILRGGWNKAAMVFRREVIVV